MYIMKSLIKKIINRIRSYFLSPLLEYPVYYDVVAQMQLKFLYRNWAQSEKQLPPLSETGFKVFSQSDEDGILLYIFSVIGTANKKSVGICAGNGIECNSANLIINHGWSGLLVDGNEKMVSQGREYYRLNRHTYVYPPAFAHAWVTRDNVNSIIKDNGFEGDIDLLSIDMDGVDYWIWKAIEVIMPRVVVVEYQDIIGPDKSLTVPYADDFNSHEYPMSNGTPNFCGASLPAFVKLAREKGYRLVGCNRYGYNAFFIRNPIGEDLIPEISIVECFKHPKVIHGIKERFPTVKDLPWVGV